ncbi:Hrp1 protein [Saccharomycopsis crataegensis]|uniref:Hrp1 protein n=1 Tax=Saccharomycopsis crataegensis TaxID=43959 RepID=A0AAV5QH73_9ASCO|nr:Hrp1 protein [Saccharomycopsis crataegensis]
MASLDDADVLFQDIYGEDSDDETKAIRQELPKEVASTTQATSTATSTVKADDSAHTIIQQPNETSIEVPSSSNTGGLGESPKEISGSGLTSVAIGRQLQEKSEFFNRDQGKMFVGGLNWETSEDKLKEYFSKFGEIIDLTIMRDNVTGRSRGFGFLTFKSSSSVDEVVKTQHILDGKVIDPKRAIPREEQDKTGKIFVGGIAPEVTEKDFDEFFSKFGNVIDAQLMIDKDTRRSRGFGFVTYDSPEAVDNVCQNQYLELKGRRMEIKRAEPRGQQQQRLGGVRGYNANTAIKLQNPPGGYQQYSNAYPGETTQAMNGAGYTPEIMQQYWQYWLQFQQMQRANGQSGNQNMNPEQSQQMLAMISQQMEGQGPNGPATQTQEKASNQGVGQAPNAENDNNPDAARERPFRLHSANEDGRINFPKGPRERNNFPSRGGPTGRGGPIGRGGPVGRGGPIGRGGRGGPVNRGGRGGPMGRGGGSSFGRGGSTGPTGANRGAIGTRGSRGGPGGATAPGRGPPFRGGRDSGARGDSHKYGGSYQPY